MYEYEFIRPSDRRDVTDRSVGAVSSNTQGVRDQDKQHSMSAAIQNEQHAAVEGGHRPRDHDTSHPDGRAATHATATPAGENASGSQAAEEPFDRQEYVIRLLTGGGGNFRDLPSVEILEDLKEEYEPVVVEGDDEFSLEAARAKEEEVWVLKLPFTVGIYQALQGYY